MNSSERAEGGLNWIDPEADPRWSAFVDAHPAGSIFHTRGWLDALRRTYDYRPIVVTSTPPGRPLANGIVMCLISSWLTGSRLVSLPFSDHCEPLVQNPNELQDLVTGAREKAVRCCRYLEVRPRSSGLAPGDGFGLHSQHCLHVLDLDQSVEELYANLHRGSVQRKIRRAAREQVVLERGRSEELLEKFYGLMVMTRRRHRIPPQPFKWFRNLMECLGDRIVIRMASVDGRPIASLITLGYKDTIVYKYGCSDARFHNLGGVASLFWEAIRDAKADGGREFDLGRGDITNLGLMQFKDRLGASRFPLAYWRSPSKRAGSVSEGLPFRLMQRGLSVVPKRLSRLAGEALYRHIG